MSHLGGPYGVEGPEKMLFKKQNISISARMRAPNVRRGLAFFNTGESTSFISPVKKLRAGPESAIKAEGSSSFFSPDGCG